MKFQCEKNVLLEAVRAASMAVASVNLPLEQNIRLSLKKKELTVLGSDSNLSIQTVVTVDGEEDGDLCLPSRLAADVLGGLSQNPDVGAVTMSTQSPDKKGDKGDSKLASKVRHSVIASGGGTQYTLHQLDVGDFKSIAIEKDVSSTTVKAKDFIGALRQVMGMASNSPSRPILNGVLISTEGTGKSKTMRLVASDTFRLGIRDMEGINLPKVVTGGTELDMVLVPVGSLSKLASLCGTAEELKISVEPTQVGFEFENTTMITQLLPGDFPDYKKLLPDNYPDKLTANKEELLGAISRVSLMAKDDPNQLVKAEINKDSLVLSAIDKNKGLAVETIKADFTGTELVVGLNSAYLRDALAALDDEKFVAVLDGASKPLFIQGDKVQSFQCLLMPVRLTSNAD